MWISTFSLAQSKYSVVAKVIDDKNKPIEFGNILILSTDDSTMITGDVFTDGIVSIINILQSHFIVKITSMQFSDYYQKIVAKSPATNLGEIKMKPLSLKEFELVENKPIITVKGDKVVVNVNSTQLADAGTVLDVLRKSPQVLVDAKDNVSIFGKGPATIYLDGQKITSTEVLKSISSTEVKEIEVIKNPSAKYDAEGTGGVINIITVKNELQGYNGSIYQNVTSATYVSEFSYFQLAYKNAKINTFASVRNYYGKRKSTNEFIRNLIGDTNITTMTNDIDNFSKTKFSPGYRFGFDYDISKTNRLGIQWKGYYNNSEDSSVNSNNITDSYGTTLLNTNTKSHNAYDNNSWILYHHLNNDSTGNDLYTAIEYGLFNSKVGDDIAENILSGATLSDNLKRSSGNNNIAIITGKSDFTHDWDSVKLTLETGIKYSETTNLSDVTFENYTNPGWTLDPSITNGYNFTEGIGAAYFQLIKEFNKVSLRAGLRAERTQTYGYSKTYDTIVTDTSYINLFPSAYLGYQLNEDWLFSLTYTDRIDRPDYEDLEPFVEYLDSVSRMVGNPLLKPEYTHSLEAEITFMEMFSVDFGYSYTKDAINTIIDKSEFDNSFIVQEKNIENEKNIYADLNIPVQVTWWTMYNSLGVSLDSYVYIDKGVRTTFEQPFWYAYIYNEFDLPKNFNIEVTFEYYSNGVDGIFQYDPVYNVDASISKTFFDDKLTLRFMANDIFSSNIENGSSTLKNFNLKYKSVYDSHSFRIAVRYTFGKLAQPDSKDRSVNGDELNRIKSGK